MSVWETISIGSDESGKGDFFGAPVVVAVKLDQSTLNELKDKEYYRHIKDSKKCSDEMIKNIAPKIMEICKYSYIDLGPKKYNKLYEETKNLNILLAKLHNDVHKEIEGNEPRIIDQFAKESTYYLHLNRLGAKIVKISNFCTGADSKYLSVALASIIARYKFIQQIEGLSSKSGVYIPYGNSYRAPNSVVTAYKGLVMKYDQKVIDTEFVKSHFSTLDKIKKSYL